ncbi:MAG: hypothetical protein IPF47_08790 [Gemmatimonadetes bacterium]|nr:hypothetical protein [Gemmatimonadota bacterium]
MWHVSHVPGKPDDACGGFFDCVKSDWWHDRHVVGFPLYTPSAWQLLQVATICLPVSGKRVVLWLNTPPVHLMVEWHVSQVLGKPEAACGGVVVALKSVWWHDTHCFERPLKTPSEWQSLHTRLECPLVSWKPVVVWSKAAPAHCCVPWQLEHVFEKPVLRCGGLVVASYFAW